MCEAGEAGAMWSHHGMECSKRRSEERGRMEERYACVPGVRHAVHGYGVDHTVNCMLSGHSKLTLPHLRARAR